MTTNSNYARSPLMDNVLNFVPEGHEKALKQAMYNAVGMVIVCVGVGALTAVYFVLEPFLRPLLWALFFGSVLYPVKRRFNNFVHRWIGDLRKSNTPVAVGSILLPLDILDQLSDATIDSVYRNWKLSAAVTIILAAPYFIYSYTPRFAITLSMFLKDIIVNILAVVLSFNPYFLWTIVVGFVLTVLFYWKMETKQGLRFASLAIWAFIFLNFSTIFGSLAAIVAIGLFVIGIGVEVSDALTQIKSQVNENSPDNDLTMQSPLKTAWSVLCGNGVASPSNESSNFRLGTQPDKEQIQKIGPSVTSPLPSQAQNLRRQSALLRQDSFSSFLSSDNDSKMSDVYLFVLLWACSLVLLFRTFTWTWPLILVLLVYLVTKKLGSHFGLWSLLWKKIIEVYVIMMEKLEDRKDALFPPPVKGLYKLLARGDRWISSLLEKMADVLTTMGSILFVLIGVILATIFLLLQIHAESMHLVQVTGNLINSTVVHNEMVQDMLPDGITNVINSMYSNAYEYGKEWVVKMVRHLIPEEDEEKSILIEVQVLELWDKIYNTWMVNSSGGVDANLALMNSSSGVIGNIIGAAPEIFNYSSIVDFVKENVDTFVAVIQASWSVLKGNVSLALSAITTIISIVFGGGSALLSFLFNLIVFLTALFYLLSGSGQQYSPIVFVSKIAPGGWGNKFAHAVEHAINGVFTASLKMSVFYGLWTWLIHKIFQVKMVYIPSVLAAIFGAIPFLGTYWAVLPAVMELWLVQGNWVLSIIIVLFQILPMSCVDTAIYSEIQGGGHPYLTGLSVAGGIFCLGVEGAIVGPLILCCFFVVFNMSTSMMSESPVNTPGKRLFGRNFLAKR